MTTPAASKIRVRYDMTVSAGAKFRAPYRMLLTAFFQVPYSLLVQQKFSLPYTERITRSVSLPFAMTAPFAAKCRLSYDLCTRVTKKVLLVYALAVTEPVRAARRLPYSIQPAYAATVQVAQPPIINVGTSTLACVSASIAQDEGTPSWSGTLKFATRQAVDLLPFSAPFTVVIGTESYAVVSLGATITRDEPGKFSATIQFASALALRQYSLPVSLYYSAAVSARSVVETILGAAVQWNIDDWTVPAGRLQIANADRLQTALKIIQAVGAVMECKPDGTPVVRYQYTVRTPDYQLQTPAEIFSNLDSVVSLSDAYKERNSYTKVTVTDVNDSSLGYLQSEVDSRDAANGGLNLAGTNFAPGDTAWVLVYHGLDVALTPPPILSAGTVLEGATVLVPVEEFLTFENTNTAAISKPYHSGLVVVWLGNNLGAISVDASSLVASVVTGGIGVAKVTYKSQAKAWGVVSPASLSGETKFPILMFNFGEQQ